MFGHDDNQANQNQEPENNSPASGAPVISPISSDPIDNNAPTPTQSIGFGSPLGDSTVPQNGKVSDDLISIKQEALQQLSPLVSHLDQSPEEKFRTTMMMIQASDDQSLIKEAYESAKQIPDEKARAQALLDIVNEINYFTQQHHS